MSKKEFKISDSYRIILTETLPYETPIIFSNEGFYDYLESKLNNPFVNSLLVDPTTTKPLTFGIQKNTYSKRILDIPHPAVQYKFTDFYKDYGPLMIDLCTRSEFSLRHPAKIASAFYEPSHLAQEELTEMSVEEEREQESTQQQFSSSFFVYKKYNFIHKFYDSYEFHNLEKKYDKLFQFDISKCFPSIYTHSIAWAVKNKEYAKKNKHAYSFERRFDSLMQNANDQETHGIIIGPEFSRIFAEIILQRIDLNVLKKAHNKFAHKIDYSIRRYVDDYFIFYNDEECLSCLKELFIEELREYKLFINESKIITSSRPFMSQISVAKFQIKDTIKWFCNTIFSRNDITETGSAKLFEHEIKLPPHIFSNQSIARFKAVIKRNNITYDSVTRLALSILNKKLLHTTKKIASFDTIKNSEEIKNRIWIYVDFLFFIFSMNITPRTTHVVSIIIFNINEFLSKINKLDAEDIRKKITDECRKIINSKSKTNSPVSLEVCNLMIALSALGNKFSISTNQINRAFNIAEDKQSNDLEHLNYLSLTSLIFCLEENIHTDLIKAIATDVAQRIDDTQNFRENTEAVLLYFDFISCSKFNEADRKIVTRIGLEKLLDTTVTPKRVGDTFNFISARKWFIDWEAKINFKQILAKKELRTPY